MHLFKIEDAIFQTIEAMYKAKEYNKIDSYDLALATLEILNEQYAEQNHGITYLTDDRIVDYYKMRWEIL